MAITSSFTPVPNKFGDPFMLPSTDSFPSDIKSTLDLCLYLYGVNRLYGSVCNRMVSYYITDIEFTDKGDTDEQGKLKKMLVDTLGIFAHMQKAGVDWSIYGNAFIRCVEPFERFLIDDRGGKFRATSLDMYPDNLVSYSNEDMTYSVPDLAAAIDLPKGERKMEKLPKVKLRFRDKAAAAPERFSIVFLDPRYIELDKAHHADSIEYIYRIPPDMESRIKSGVLNEVNHTPRGLLEAVSKGKDFRFRRGEVYHFRSPTPTGVSDSGWAVPEILMHYNSLYQLQIYRKADFAVAQDFLLPMRVFTPDLGGAQVGDAVMNLVLSRWKSEMTNMIARHRADPTTIHALPFMANYAEHGGDGKRMVMYDVVEAYTDALFDGLGFPRELFRGTMNPEQLPNSIRMFERQYEWLYRQLDGMVRFISNTVQRAFQADELEVRLKRPMTAYNADWMQLQLQLAANREIPRSDVYPDMGIPDPVNAAVRAVEEDQEIQRKVEPMAADFQKEITAGSMADVAIAQAEQGAQAAAGGAPPGGAPPGGGGGGLDYSVDPKADPGMLQDRAQQIGAEWQRMHEEQPNSHRKEMQAAEATNPTLYAAAKDAMEKIRAGGASAGRAQASQTIAPQQ